MPRVARIGDAGSHGGEIVSGSPNVNCNRIPAARVGDTYACPIHGPNPIVAGSPTVRLNSRDVARIGDPTACGAVIVEGSPNVTAGD